MPLTQRERICLDYLNDKMEATASMIGEAIHKKLGGSTNYSTVGTNVLVSLKRHGFVTRIPELNAWRITTAGRAVRVDE